MFILRLYLTNQIVRTLSLLLVAKKIFEKKHLTATMASPGQMKYQIELQLVIMVGIATNNGGHY